MKKFLLSSLFIIIFLLNNYCLFPDDFNFNFINSPSDDKYELGVVKFLADTNIIVTQIFSTNPYKLYKLYFSTDNGNFWKMHDTFAVVSKKPAFAIYNNILYAAPLISKGPDGFPYGGMVKTTDYGFNWIGLPVDAGVEINSKNCNININSRGNIYVTSDAWASRSTDDDEHWFGSSWPLIKYSDINKKTDDIYISDSIYGFYKITHIVLGYPLSEHFNKPDLIFEIIRVTDKSELIGYSKVKTEPKGLYLSIDDTTWNLIKSIDESTEVNVIEPYKNLIIIGTSNGMEYSDNSGASWYPINLPDITGVDKSITSISISDSGDIYVVYGNHYLIKGKIPVTNVSDKDKPKTILKISPNPFSSSFNMSFTSISTVTISIDLYDILGNKIYSKSLGFLESGQHQTMLNPGLDLSPGCYVVAVRCGASVQYLKVLKGE